MELIVFDKDTGEIKFRMELRNYELCKKLIKGKNLQIGRAVIKEESNELYKKQ